MFPKQKIHNIIYAFRGRGKMVNDIISRFPKEDGIETYIEPFGGSFIVGFHAVALYPNVVFNDLDKNIYSLYKVLSDKDKMQKLKEMCETTFYHEEIYNECKAKLPTETDELKRAYYFFVMNRMSFNGVGTFLVNLRTVNNISTGLHNYIKSFDDYFEEFYHRMIRVMYLNQNGIDLIKQYDNEQVFFFCDPPMGQFSTHSYTFSNEDHSKFLDVVMSLKKAKVLIIADERDDYEVLKDNGFYKDTILKRKISTRMKTKDKKEVIWTNYY